ncbi:prepilin-type N-terminal cleavage/methylation domain-containing protein [Glaciecola siphonariae]|uniref:Prepilin-type N-terminal cleavage/methylation domain-containing protein n=1 Tax=Glaciecola siphonariae TaxID=521012 RepID=A0ABV9LWY6_9ALTE
MPFACVQTRLSSANQRGFTLVELITVVIVIGIIAVAAAPRFISTDSFSEYAMVQRLQTAMRTLQIQSMHDTRPNFCYKMNFATGSSSAFGPSVHQYQNGQQVSSCANSIDFTAPKYLRSDADELSANNITLSALDSGVSMSGLSFNSLGQPITNVGNCAGGCEIRFVGTMQAKVCVASQGYVYAC